MLPQIRPGVPPAVAGQGDVGMTMGRPTINSNIAARLAPQLNRLPAVAGRGEAPPMISNTGQQPVGMIRR